MYRFICNIRILAAAVVIVVAFSRQAAMSHVCDKPSNFTKIRGIDSENITIIARYCLYMSNPTPFLILRRGGGCLYRVRIPHTKI